ncbi:MAG: polysaccharide deacetylase family protein [Alicyclobacillus sp.]|nr:polysaccharide deacetylase family protein [Alicyclobacillus sp.]
MDLMQQALERARQGSATGWPLVLYFHHVHPTLDHYTSLKPDHFARSLDLVLRLVGPALDPAVLSAKPEAWQPETPSVLITFDDGYRDNVEYALPILERFGVKALFFVITGKIGQSLDRERDPWKEYMTWDELRDIQKAGHMIGAHTVSHPKLHELSVKDAQRETEQSILEIGRQIGVNPVHFAYPYGFVPQKKLEMPRGTLAFGTVKAQPRPWVDEPWNIRRTYLPTGQMDTWTKLCEGWRQQWFELQ